MASTWKYHAFISFRGEDTRNNFIGHLYKELTTKGIYTFKDDQTLARGESISSALIEAIKESRISIVVLSENYAFSGWCLDELLNIIECRETMGQIVVPIFYKVDPSDVREQRGNFRKALSMHQENFNFSGGLEKVKKWREALTEVASISGWNLRDWGDQATFIDRVVRDISDKVSYESSSNATDLVGMRFHVTEMDKGLHFESNVVLMVGIWGMGGIGKTTIARVVYDNHFRQFEAHCFLASIEDKFKKHGTTALKEELLSKILLERKLSMWPLFNDFNIIKERLCHRKVLIVLDGVDNLEQLQELAKEPNWFGLGSRIIITTRNKHLLDAHGVNAIYEVKYLENDQALQLFCQCAFKQNQPGKDYLHLSNDFVSYAKGLPLALKLLGSFLYNRSTIEWQSELEKLKTFPHTDIQNVLKISYDGLEDIEKDVFLDIACFFNGEDKDFVRNILDGCGFFPDRSFRVLMDKALVTISNNKLYMHELLRDMGCEIVRQHSSKEIGERTRLWNPDDIQRVFRHNTGTKKVEGMFLDMPELKETMRLNCESFTGMYNLRLLKFYNSLSYGCNIVQLPEEGLQYLSDELRYLYWHAYPLKSLPSNFSPKKLVVISLPHSNIEQLWTLKQDLVNLKSIDLNHSNLTRIPDLSEAQKLESLNLRGCINLFEVSSIQYLTKLEYLDMEGCKNLRSLPSMRGLKLLSTLNLSNCSNLKKLPLSIGNSGLVRLNLRNCTGLENLPSGICSLKSLVHVNIAGCSNLLKLLTGTEMGELSSSTGYLSDTSIDHSNLTGIPDPIAQLQSLNLENSLNLHEVSPIQHLTELRYLNLSGCKNLRNLPNVIGLKHLRTLNLSGCSNLKKLPELSRNMKNLYLVGNAIKELPASIGCLSHLVTLDLGNCKKLKNLPSSTCKLKSLETLNISGCSELLKILS